MDNILTYLRYDWPLHFILFFTNWLPDNVIFLRLRGFLARFFLGECGKDLRLGRNLTFHNPSSITLGDHVFIAYGCSFMAIDKITIADEVMFGPYCIVISGNHTSLNGSFRYGPPSSAPINIGKGSWIASRVVVTAGCTIGKNTLIAASAVVTKDIPSNVIAGGIPAHVIKSTEPVSDGS